MSNSEKSVKTPLNCVLRLHKMLAMNFIKTKRKPFYSKKGYGDARFIHHSSEKKKNFDKTLFYSTQMKQTSEKRVH